jgi:hypothetical protein
MHSSSVARWISSIALTCAVIGHAGTLTGPIRNPANGVDYYLIEGGTWQQSHAEALQMEGHLAVIEDAAENQWIAETFRPHAPRFWIGYTDFHVEGEFRTVDGRKSTYRNFGPGQPDNRFEQDHVEMVLGTSAEEGAFWDDQDSRVLLPALVKVSPMPIVLTGPILSPINGSTYYLLSDSSWTKAQAKARELGGNLATVASMKENNWILETFGNWDAPRQAHLWIGLTDADDEGRFTWVSGEPARFRNWDNWEPNNAFGTEHFTHMFPNGVWNDLFNHGLAESMRLHLGVVEIQRPYLDIRVSEVELRWRTETALQYQIQQRIAEPGSPWTDLGSVITGTGNYVTNKMSIPADSAHRVFRVVESPR